MQSITHFYMKVEKTFVTLSKVTEDSLGSQKMIIASPQ